MSALTLPVLEVANAHFVTPTLLCERAAEVAIGDHRNSRRVIRARLAVES